MDIHDELWRMPHDELQFNLAHVLQHPDYEDNAYTRWMRQLIQKADVKPQEAQAIRTHLAINKKLWY